MRGYDIDGVLTKGIVPEKPYVIISGRTVDQWEQTIKEVGTEAPIYLRPYGNYGDHYLAGFWKTEMINKLNITEYFEDVRLQAAIIEANCPNCKVRLIK